ncbi:TPA: integrase [Pseudomonas aeruginosa]|uniref:integrase n=1 Tax=Pseudomonas aeruginosa TaxID=287 RepID=UPI001572EA63|nr:integrase [Pseudomonas aeruginosa]NTT92204.1 integrase [Pseudomonas aeruginosa]HCF3157280.1 integrase [Pseudomonas aeruginosa]HDR2968310.1 integrase [Pseudomonas aeruginosa]
MGRRPTKPGSIPRLRERRRGDKIYYYYDLGGKPRKELSLGTDYGLAITEYARLERARTADAKLAETLTFRYVAQRYFIDVVPTKSPTTQKDNARELKQLLAFFDDPPAAIGDIEPKHIKQYLIFRRSAPVRANREISLFSAIWNYAREMGYTKLAKPCSGVKRNRERGRDVYVEDDLYAVVYEAADQGLKDAMDLSYLTAQRVADTLKMDERDIRDGTLAIRQGKTLAKRRIDKAREAAGIPKSAFQFRDLRAKGGTDTAESSGDILQARDQLGHTTVTMTEHYIRDRKDKKVKPTK